jgi:hypothetical protein
LNRRFRTADVDCGVFFGVFRGNLFPAVHCVFFATDFRLTFLALTTRGRVIVFAMFDGGGDGVKREVEGVVGVDAKLLSGESDIVLKSVSFKPF